MLHEPLRYLFLGTDCLRGLTIMGRIMTPAVKTHIGATTISMDSNDINFLLYLTVSIFYFFSHAYLYLIINYLYNYIYC